MFKSIESWCNYPIKIKRNTGHTISGDISTGEEVSANCYAVDEAILITDKNGKEYVSRAQLYLGNAVLVDEADQVIYDNTKYEIRKLSVYRDGDTNTVNAQVIYL
jgi:hypothetical protein